MSSDRQNHGFSLVTCGLLVAAVLAIYAQTFDFPFVHWDDPAYVTRNPVVREGLTRDSFVWALTDTQEINWHPVTWLSHMADVEVFGLEAGGHHQTSVFLHALNSLLVFGLLFRMTGAGLRSALVAGLFAVHPLHVESVAWVSERKDVLSTFFALLATYGYLNYVRYAAFGGNTDAAPPSMNDVSTHSPSAPRAVALYLVSILCFALALMSKSMVVTLPAVFCLIDLWPLRRGITMRTLVEKIPFVLLAAGTSLLALQTQEDAGAMVRAEPLPVPARLANAVFSYVWYLQKTVWPTDLSMLYPHPYIPESGGIPLTAWEIGFSAFVLAGLSLWVIRSRSSSWAFVGWSWFLGTLVPVIGLVQVGHQGMADRYLYFPSIGLFMLIVWAGFEGRARFFPGPWAGRLFFLATAGVLLAFTQQARMQTAHWRSTETLYEHALEAVPRNPKIRFNVANRLRDAGEIDRAIAEYRRALDSAPNAPKPNLNLANLLRKQGKTEQAIAIYRRILEVSPENQLAHINLASAYRSVSKIDAAIEHSEKALELGPSAAAEFNLANLLRSAERHSEAILHYERAISQKPNQPKAHNNLGISLLEIGEAGQAAQHFAMALRLDPQHHRAANNLGVALAEQGNLSSALEATGRAIAIAPRYASAHRNHASTLARMGRFEQARQHFVHALEIDPLDPEARRGLEELPLAP